MRGALFFIMTNTEGEQLMFRIAHHLAVGIFYQYIMT